MKIAAVLLAAGASTRMGVNKLTLNLGGISVLERSARALKAAGVEEIVIAVSEDTRAHAEIVAEKYGCKVVAGGNTRGESVYNGLKTLSSDIVVIHDGARCLVTPDIISSSIQTAIETGSGIAAVKSRDTLRHEEAGTLDRSRIYTVQTPQTFDYDRILAAYESARMEGIEATDDCAIYERMWGKASVSKGSIINQKLTEAEDLSFFEAITGEMRTGFGEDTHRLTEGRKLILGGVDVPFDLGLLGHSDADVLTHAVIDALLGAAALGDIGRMFPDSDAVYKGICSLRLLEMAWGAVKEKGYSLCNVDAVIVAQQPKLAPHIQTMGENIARVLECDVDRVSVKATTPEHTGPEGNLECITARCVCTLRR